MIIIKGASDLPKNKVPMAKQIVCKYFKTFLAFINEVYKIDKKKHYILAKQKVQLTKRNSVIIHRKTAFMLL